MELMVEKSVNLEEAGRRVEDGKISHRHTHTHTHTHTHLVSIEEQVRVPHLQQSPTLHHNDQITINDGVHTMGDHQHGGGRETTADGALDLWGFVCVCVCVYLCA
jgi:hypothetical protein